MDYIQNIRDHYCYEPLTGKVFWTKRTSNRVKLFSEAGAMNQFGYMVSSLAGKQNLLHRVIMEIILGRKLGKKEVVDHINGKRDDNRLENLRLCDHATNARAHRCKASGKTSKYMGVFLNKNIANSRSPWVASITQGDKNKRMHKKSEIEAAMAYDEMARELDWPEEGMNFPKKVRVA